MKQKQHDTSDENENDRPGTELPETGDNGAAYGEGASTGLGAGESRRAGAGEPSANACSAGTPWRGRRPDFDASETGDTDPALMELVDEFTERTLAGESVEIEDFVAAHPDWAGPLRTLLPTLQRLGRANRADAVNDPGAVTGSRDAQGRKVFGDFRIVREIARGGMGVVYEAEQVTLGRTVALKVLPLAASLDPRALQRFQLEAQVAGLLQHPRIVPVHAVGMVDDVPYYAMQYIEGGSLAELITTLKQLDAGSAVTDPSDNRGFAAAARRFLRLSPRESPGAPGAGRVRGLYPGAEPEAPPHPDPLPSGARETMSPASSPPPDPHPASSLSALAASLLSGRWSRARGPAESRAGSPTPIEPAAPLPLADGHRSIRNQSYFRAIARLGIEAAEAVGHAHDQGIVHRDIKPANILLNRKGELWVADFGMADVQGRDGLTMTGDLPGTLRYMSPEQALGKRSLVDRRTDIYALGATLYELLALRPVVPGTDKQEMLRRIADEEPEPLRKLNPAVPVDLATIVAKCLAKDPANRYQTAWQLGDELTRFLDGRPIAARPVGALARTWRWCRRKPAQACLAACLILAVSVGFAGIMWNWREAVRQRRLTAVERDQKEVQRAKADAINRFLIDKLLLQAAPEHNTNARSLTLRAALDAAADEVASSFGGQPEIEAAIRLALGQTYHELGEFARSEAHLRRSLELSRLQKDAAGPDQIRCITELGHILEHLNRKTEAEALLRQASDEGRRVLGASHETTLLATRYLAALYGLTGRRREGEAMLRQSLDEARRGGRGNSPEANVAMSELAGILLQDGRLAEAEGLYRASVKYQLESVGPRHPDTLATTNNLAYVLGKMGRLEEAEALFRQTLETERQVIGPEHPATLRNIQGLAEVVAARGRPDEAEALLRSCLEIQRRTLGPHHSDTQRTQERLKALVADRAGKK